MDRFILTGTASVVSDTNNRRTAYVHRFIKEGTLQKYYAPLTSGNRINKVMYTRLHLAEDAARKYLNRKIQNQTILNQK